MKLRLAWWNTGLAGKKPSVRQISDTAKVIRALMREESCAVVGLCEVRPSVLEPLLKEVLQFPYATWRPNAPQPDLPRPHDLLVLFDPRIVSVTTREPVFAEVADHRVYAGLVFDLGLPQDQSMRLALCHWPAELGNHRHAEKLRNASAFTMKSALASAGTLHDSIVLGDFNAEPFSEAMESMGGNRDLEQVRKRRGLLYNAGWRWLGSRRPFDGRDLTCSPPGTYLMRSGGRERVHGARSTKFSSQGRPCWGSVGPFAKTRPRPGTGMS